MTLVEETKGAFETKFKMRDLGPLNWFLGIEFAQSDGQIKMSQKKYFDKILTKFEMQDSKVRSKPCDEGLAKEVDESPRLEDPRLYREIVGSLIYAMSCTRPDLSYVVTKLAQTMSEPTERDMKVAKGVLRYIKGTANFGVSFSKSSENLSGYCDAD